MAIRNFKRKERPLESSFALLLFLQLFAIVLSFGGPLSFLSPVPLVLAILIFGRLPTLIFAGVFSGIGSYLITKMMVAGLAFMSGTHLFAVLCAFLIGEVIIRNINPVKGLIASGFIIVTLAGGVLLTSDKLGYFSTKDQVSKGVDQVVRAIKENNKEILEQNNEESRNIKSFIAEEKEIAAWIYSYLPAIIFISVFFVLWMSFYSSLRLAKMWRYKNLYSFTTRDLISFKTPEYFVYPLIGSLVMYVGADYGLAKNFEIMGGNILYCLGIFYLFQGFGIYYDFLTFIRIGGFFKSAIMAFTLLAAHKFLAIFGMFDLWFDFRKYFTKKNNDEGDIL